MKNTNGRRTRDPTEDDDIDIDSICIRKGLEYRGSSQHNSRNVVS